MKNEECLPDNHSQLSTLNFQLSTLNSQLSTLNSQLSLDYSQTIKYLYDAVPMFQRVGAAGYKPGLATTIALDEYFGRPHRLFRTIHVAGTNGKGSCSHTLAAILGAQGYHTGLYTSPHLTDFRERIRIDGRCIEESYVTDFVNRHRLFFEPLAPSFFELTTAMAFKYFADNNVDIAVIETGLGGRLDCTNIITPQVSVITNIALDHTQFLGNTPAAIAGEKAGIIKPHVPVVIGERLAETRPVFDARAAAMHSPLCYAEDDNEIIAYDICPDNIVYDTRSYGKIRGQLTGMCQIKNTRTILSTVRILIEQGIITSVDAVGKGFADVCTMTGLRGRWQTVSRRPTVICDTGHNADAWQHLSRQLAATDCRTLRIVFGMVADKDIDSVMNLLPRRAVYYWTKASTPRAMNETDVMHAADNHGLTGRMFAGVGDAFAAAKNDADPEDVIFVGGSSYIVADFLGLTQKCH